MGPLNDFCVPQQIVEKTIDGQKLISIYDIYAYIHTQSNLEPEKFSHIDLTHWGRVTHICVGKLTTIGSDNGLSPGRRQAIIWTNDGILLLWTLGTNFYEILSEIHSFSFEKTHLKLSSAKWRLSRLGLNELNP